MYGRGVEPPFTLSKTSKFRGSSTTVTVSQNWSLDTRFFLAFFALLCGISNFIFLAKVAFFPTTYYEAPAIPEGHCTAASASLMRVSVVRAMRHLLSSSMPEQAFGISRIVSTGIEIGFLLSASGMKIDEKGLRISNPCSAIARLIIALMVVKQRLTYAF